jgi:hypothetical protein
MRGLGILGILLAVSLSSPAAAKVKIDIRPREGQVSKYFDGSEAITSIQQRTVVGFLEMPQEEAKKRATLYVLSRNIGDTPYNFGPENITAEAGAVSIAVVTYDQLAKEQKNKGFWKRFAGAMAGGFSSAGAANAGTTTGTVSAYGSGGYAHGTYTTYDPAKAQQAQANANAENRRTMDRIEQNQQAAMAALGDNLRTTTIEPGAFLGGEIVFELPRELRNAKKPTAAIITVKVADETHVFDVWVIPD